MNFTSVQNNKKTINLKNKNKNYEVNAQWLYEHSTNSKIRDNYTNQLLIEAAEIDEHSVSYTHLTLPTIYSV